MLVMVPLLYLAVCGVLGIALAESTLRLPPQHVFAERLFRYRMQKQFGAQVLPVSLNAADGATLRAWWVTPRRPNGRSVLLLHGIGGNRVDMSGYADIFVPKGYDVLLPDSRGHGESGGRVSTFGLLERDDVHRWAEFARARAPGCTYVLGESMGAAITVEATAVTPQICAAAVEDPFARFRPVVYERLGHETGLGTHFWQTLGWPVVQVAIHWAHFRYGLWLPDAAPERALRQSHAPILLMTGTADKNIPMHHALDLEKACAGPCALWVVPGAGHGGISAITGGEFGYRILSWFRAHDAPLPALPVALTRRGSAEAGGWTHPRSLVTGPPPPTSP